MKKISSKSRECAEAIGRREPFNTYGALCATDHKVGPWDSGRLSGEDLDRFRADMPHITYVVWSYATPIAWVAGDEVYRVKQKFSVTTSQHQGKLYML
jgi:hypothetical protein